MEVMNKQGLTTAVCLTENSVEAMGINSEEQKAELEARIREKFPR
jgi:hypothetical protein